jgi:proline racemase|tara:strand:+ start:1040 stop:2077 length:1038 start_codon:yes stop_codon:yes gene_type:complete
MDMAKLRGIEPNIDWVKIKTIDMHTGGEPLRVILEGYPLLRHASVLENRKFLKENHDHLRQSLMFEPRGHSDMYGVVVVPSQRADFGVVFMHNDGYSTMCGHATIAITKLAVDSGWVEKVEPQTKVLIEAPCGILTAYAEVIDQEVVSVSFENVPSFVVALDQIIKTPELGTVQYDLAYGGAFYAFVNAVDLGLKCDPPQYQKLIRVGMAIKQAISLNGEAAAHPYEEDLSFLYGTIFIESSKTSQVDSRNVCVFANGQLDRSPTGSGVSARLAIHHARKELALNHWMTIESILGTQFKCQIKESVKFSNYDAVIPIVQGQAFYTGKNEFWIDPNDPLSGGFMLR